MARLLQRPAVREPVQFRPRRGDGQVRSGVRDGLMGIVGLVLYVFLMVYFYRQDLRAEITDKRKATTTTTSSSERYRADDAPDAEMGGAGGGNSPRAPPPRSAYDNAAYEDEAPAPASQRFESAYADSPESPPPPPARVENPYDKPAGGGAGASPVAKNPFE